MLVPHLRIKKGDINRKVIIVGDPARVLKITKHLKNVKKIGDNRGFITYNGDYEGVKLSVCNSGIGGPSAGIVIEELIKCGAEIIIRAGSGGVLRKEINTGDIIISTGVCKEEKSTQGYVPPEFAAVPDFNVLKALIESAEESGNKYYHGVTMCCDSFYAENHKEKMKDWMKLNVIGSDMESSMLFTLAQIRGVKAGFLFYAGLNVARNDVHADIIKQEKLRVKGEENAIIIALNAMKKL
ncbi:MAG: nucleoside phosphorylase [Nanoarchaeota archaeon]|nr:nucleoside phosphorylase [Nanoarchaeota archaeon]